MPGGPFTAGGYWSSVSVPAVPPHKWVLAFGGQDVAVASVALRQRRQACRVRVCTGEVGIVFESATVNCRSGSKCASIGFTHEA
jgi:hypothetical protein